MNGRLRISNIILILLVVGGLWAMFTGQTQWQDSLWVTLTLFPIFLIIGLRDEKEKRRKKRLAEQEEAQNRAATAQSGSTWRRRPNTDRS